MDVKLSKVLREAVAADLIGLSPRTLQRMRQDGDGPRFVNLTDRRVGYPEADLADWLHTRSVRSTSEATVARSKRSKQ